MRTCFNAIERWNRDIGMKRLSYSVTKCGLINKFYRFQVIDWSHLFHPLASAKYPWH